MAVISLINLLPENRIKFNLTPVEGNFSPFFPKHCNASNQLPSSNSLANPDSLKKCHNINCPVQTQAVVNGQLSREEVLCYLKYSRKTKTSVYPLCSIYIYLHFLCPFLISKNCRLSH